MSLCHFEGISQHLIFDQLIAGDLANKIIQIDKNIKFSELKFTANMVIIIVQVNTR
jgi:hypothetical protein